MDPILSYHESFKLEKLSWLWLKRGVMMKEESKRCSVSGSDDGGRKQARAASRSWKRRLQKGTQAC